ncbi:hypothetical protein EST38_g11230, partial [Candolleomyces aberdarensis]
MDPTGNSSPKKGRRMAFLLLLRRGFLKLRWDKDAGKPPSGDEQPASCTIQILPNSSHFSVGSLTVNINNNNSAESRGVERTVQVIQRKLPQAVGFSNANALIITDALGETFTLPWWIVATYQDLHDALSKRFRGKV